MLELLTCAGVCLALITYCKSITYMVSNLKNPACNTVFINECQSPVTTSDLMLCEVWYTRCNAHSLKSHPPKTRLVSEYTSNTKAIVLTQHNLQATSQGTIILGQAEHHIELWSEALLKHCFDQDHCCVSRLILNQCMHSMCEPHFLT